MSKILNFKNKNDDQNAKENKSYTKTIATKPYSFTYANYKSGLILSYIYKRQVLWGEELLRSVWAYA